MYNLEESLQKLVDPMVQLQNTSTYVGCDREKIPPEFGFGKGSLTGAPSLIVALLSGLLGRTLAL